MAAKFTVFLDKSKKYRFNLKASNGEIIASSEAYETKKACLNGIKSIQKSAPIAKIIDLDPALADAKKVPAKKPAAKKTVTKKTAVKTSAAKKPAARKPAAKKASVSKPAF
jgi:uncharacterized protein YegP (UPF0339 family)